MVVAAAREHASAASGASEILVAVAGKATIALRTEAAIVAIVRKGAAFASGAVKAIILAREDPATFAISAVPAIAVLIAPTFPVLIVAAAKAAEVGHRLSPFTK